jgi:hypothetical protein
MHLYALLLMAAVSASPAQISSLPSASGSAPILLGGDKVADQCRGAAAFEIGVPKPINLTTCDITASCPLPPPPAGRFYEISCSGNTCTNTLYSVTCDGTTTYCSCMQCGDPCYCNCYEGGGTQGQCLEACGTVC